MPMASELDVLKSIIYSYFDDDNVSRDQITDFLHKYLFSCSPKSYMGMNYFQSSYEPNIYDNSYCRSMVLETQINFPFYLDEFTGKVKVVRAYMDDIKTFDEKIQDIKTPKNQSVILHKTNRFKSLPNDENIL